MRPRKLVRCWNCKHLKTVHQGEPKDGRLFAKEFKQCAAHGMILKHHEILRERECDDHVRFGLWETPPTIQSWT